MSEMRMALEAFAAGELDYAGLQRAIAEQLAVGVSVDDAVAELHAICESDGMSQGLYNVLRRAITRVGDGDDTDAFPEGKTRPTGGPARKEDAALHVATDPDLPAMFTHPEELLPDELPHDPLTPGKKTSIKPEIVLPDETEALDVARAPLAEEAGLGADALITGVRRGKRNDKPVEQKREVGVPEPGDVIADRYVIQSILGRGGMGIVYRALDRCREACESDDALVALKMLRPELHEHEGSDRRLLLEALQGQRLMHPNLVRILDVGMDQGRAFVTMELIEGELLRSALTRRTPDGFPGDEALEIIAGIGKGLANLHRHGYVHSDLKPRNVLLAGDGQPKLLDFGLSRRPGRALEPVLDGGDVPARTPAYASPQLLRGEAAGFDDDVFAMACVASELLTGRHPFGRVPADQARDRNLKPTRVRSLSGYQNKAINRALSFRAARRPADADEFLRDMGLAEESPRDRGPGFLQGALLGLGAGLLLTLAIISPDGPLQRLMSGSGHERQAVPPVVTRETRPAITPGPVAERPRVDAPQPEAERGVSIGGTFSPADEPVGDDAPGEPLPDAADSAESGPEIISELAVVPAEQAGSTGSDETAIEAVPSVTSEAPPVVEDPEAVIAPSPGRLAFETDAYEVDEGSAVLIARVVRSEGTRGEIAFRWRTLGGTAAPDEDYIATDWQRTSMADGQTAARIFVPLVNDGLAETQESFYLELADPEGGVTLVEDPRMRVVIRDDDRR